MIVKFAKEKSEYSRLLVSIIDLNISQVERRLAIERLVEIEKYIKDKGDDIQIIVTTRDTYKGLALPAMSEEDIKKQ